MTRLAHAAAVVASAAWLGCAAGSLSVVTPAVHQAEPEGPAELAVPPPAPECFVDWRVEELQASRLDLAAACPAPEGTRWFPIGGPRGVAWDTTAGTAEYTPDWMEGGDRTVVPFEGWRDGVKIAGGTVTIEVSDVVRPPVPRIVEDSRDPSSVPGDAGYWFAAEVETDAFLDSSERAGRRVRFVVSVPPGAEEAAARSVPIELTFHGLDGTPAPSVDGSFHVALHDPENTYWWGYAPNPRTADSFDDVPDYTLRQALWALEWTLRTFPAADPARAYVHGSSMGGAGAATAGLLHARHFAWVSAHIGQTIPRNHRPRRLEQLESLWGEAGPVAADPAAPVSIWDHLDLTRALLFDREAQDQFVFTRHGKDDRIIHFGAVVQPSPLTGVSFYDALQQSRIGHFVVWDESGHGANDPLLPPRWWHTNWHPITDETTRLSLEGAFLAFTNASSDEDTGGLASRNGAVWSRDAGFAADHSVAGDTGWAGDLAGARNRGLRWDSNRMIDRVDRFSVPVHVLDGDGAEAPAPGYPCLFDRFCGTLPAMVDITIRRVQAFRLAPNEPVRWTCGDQSGEAAADGTGVLTIREILLEREWRELRVERIWG